MTQESDRSKQARCEQSAAFVVTEILDSRDDIAEQVAAKGHKKYISTDGYNVRTKLPDWLRDIIYGRQQDPTVTGTTDYEISMTLEQDIDDTVSSQTLILTIKPMDRLSCKITIDNGLIELKYNGTMYMISGSDLRSFLQAVCPNADVEINEPDDAAQHIFMYSPISTLDLGYEIATADHKYGINYVEQETATDSLFTVEVRAQHAHPANVMAGVRVVVIESMVTRTQDGPIGTHYTPVVEIEPSDSVQSRDFTIEMFELAGESQQIPIIALTRNHQEAILDALHSLRFDGK